MQTLIWANILVGVNMSDIIKADTINAKTDRNINIGNDSINTVKQILND